MQGYFTSAPTPPRRMAGIAAGKRCGTCGLHRMQGGSSRCTHSTDPANCRARPPRAHARTPRRYRQGMTASEGQDQPDAATPQATARSPAGAVSAPRLSRPAQSVQSRWRQGATSRRRLHAPQRAHAPPCRIASSTLASSWPPRSQGGPASCTARVRGAARVTSRVCRTAARGCPKMLASCVTRAAARPAIQHYVNESTLQRPICLQS